MASSSYTLPLLILSFLLLSLPAAPSNDVVIESVVAARAERTSRLHFYFQDKPSTPDPTAVRIIGDRVGFGATYMIDDALTRDAARDSEVVGRAQGTYSVAAQNDLALLMVVVFHFSEGEYNGSSLSMMGRNHVYDEVREMPIVGGSGAFRFARGYALAHTVWLDAKTGDATVEYNVTVIHL